MSQHADGRDARCQCQVFETCQYCRPGAPAPMTDPTPEPTFTEADRTRIRTAIREADAGKRPYTAEEMDYESDYCTERQSKMLRFAARRARQTEHSTATVEAIGDLLLKRGKPILNAITDRYQVGMLLENIARLCGNPTYAKWIEDACMSQPTSDPEAR